jgi:phosphoribosylformimino-5-aminoimidazole carboxamide ribotide isomerase
LDIFPAIDIHRGQVVRASRSDLSHAVVYDPDPLAVADRFAAAGAQWIHVVDLDRAFGVGEQTALVAAIVKRLNVPVQVGGGLWRPDDVAELRDVGVQRVLLGSRVAVETHTLNELVDQFAADCLGIAVDIDKGRVWSRDWPEAVGWVPAALATQAAKAGLRSLAVTELSREGRLGGADVAQAAELARATGMDVLVSGGVDSLEDLRRIDAAGLAGAIVGRALFEGRFTLEEALACLSSSP